LMAGFFAGLRLMWMRRGRGCECCDTID